MCYVFAIRDSVSFCYTRLGINLYMLCINICMCILCIYVVFECRVLLYEPSHGTLCVGLYPIQVWHMSGIHFIPPDLMHHANIFKGQPCRFASVKLVPNWYKMLPPDHLCQAEMKDSTVLGNKTNTAQSCVEDQILEHLILRTRFCTFVLNDE